MSAVDLPPAASPSPVYPAAYLVTSSKIYLIISSACFFSARDCPFPVASKAFNTSAWAYSRAYYVASLAGAGAYYGAAVSLVAGAGAYFTGSAAFSGAFSVTASDFSVESVIVVSPVYSAS